MEQFTKTYVIPSSVTTVYDAWVSSKTVIPPAIKNEITAEVDGEIHIWTKFCDVESEMIGKFSVVEPYKKLIYSWEWNQDHHISMVCVEFSETQTNQTEVKLTHSGFTNPESATLHSDGWDHYLEGFTESYS